MSKDSGAALSFDSEHRLRSENLSFDIDVWYPKLKQWSFDSVFIPLKREEAESILAFHDYSWRNCTKILTERHVEVLKNLEACIDNEIQVIITSQNTNNSIEDTNKSAAFIRLCGRSPKDGEPLHRAEFPKQYAQVLQHLLEVENYPDNANTKMIAISRIQYMKISTGAEAMSLLLTSERVMAEMIDWLKYGEPEQLCIRSYENQLSIDYEFRCFVYRGQITSISQYDHYTYYPYLLPQQEMLTVGIYNLWKSIHLSVNDPDSSYVIDVAYLKESGRFMLVELSPFTPCTGAALFHWQTDKLVLQGVKSDSVDVSYTKDSTTAVEAVEYTNSADNHSKNSKIVITASTSLLTPADLLAIENITFRLKQECDIHPQLADLVEINWDMRWREEKTPYHIFYENAAVERQRIAQEYEESRARDAYMNTMVGRFWSLFSSDDAGSCITNTAVVTQNNTPDNHNCNTNITNNINGSTKIVEPILLFVYGTLKSNFQWNNKYLHARFNAHCVSQTVTTKEKYALVVGESGVPYLLGDVLESVDGGVSASDNATTAHYSPNLNHIRGELWSVDSDTLRGLDEYEGVSKGYYSRRAVEVRVSGDSGTVDGGECIV